MRLMASLLAIPLAALSINAQAEKVMPSPPSIAAKAYVLMDYHTGQILVQHNAEERLAPASLTKMMTSYIIGQQMNAGKIKNEDEVMISENAWSKNFPDSSKMFIEVGKTVTVAELNKGIVIQSGNDACVAMAEHIAGSEDAFADLMNSWAAKLGMNDSHFVNSHGLDNDEHYTTAKDMATLGVALIRDVPDEYSLYAEKEFTYNNITQYNRNSLLWDSTLNVDGIKTGHTSAAGYSLVSSATNENMRLVAVVMGTESEKARKAESKKLLTYGFRFYETYTPFNKGQELVKERVWMGSQEYASLGVNTDTAVTIPRGEGSNLQAEFALSEQLRAPIEQGQVVGKVYYTLGSEKIAEFDLVALEPVEEGSWFRRLIDYLTLLIKSWF